MGKLTEKEIEKRLIRLRNLERLYGVARERIEKLEKENKTFRELILSQKEIIEALKLRLEELEKMIFGKNRKNQDKENRKRKNIFKIKLFKKKEKREKESYRREVPKEITGIKNYFLKSCPCCKNELEKRKTIIRYKEDIPLNIKKIAEKQNIETGYCNNCQKRFSAIEISKQESYLGENVKQFICYSNIVQRQSFSQTRNILACMFNISVSEGEISNILERQAQILMPVYHQLENSIRNQGKAHFDETTYKVQSEEKGKYAWIMTSALNQDSVFRLGQSRGMGNAQKLKGESDIIGITDDYGAYKNLFNHHQLCWAHVLRKLRDLANSEILGENKRKYAREIYVKFNEMHEKLKKEIEKPFNLKNRLKIKEKLIKQAEILIQSNVLDCSKLKTIKQTFSKNKDKYFTCLLFEDIPTTNNKAERNLRHLVLKRKSSFGSKTQKGADVMSILCSVLLSLWWRSKDNFFSNYSFVLEKGCWI